MHKNSKFKSLLFLVSLSIVSSVLSVSDEDRMKECEKVVENIQSVIVRDFVPKGNAPDIKCLNPKDFDENFDSKFAIQVNGKTILIYKAEDEGSYEFYNWAFNTGDTTYSADVKYNEDRYFLTQISIYAVVNISESKRTYAENLSFIKQSIDLADHMVQNEAKIENDPSFLYENDQKELILPSIKYIDGGKDENNIREWINKVIERNPVLSQEELKLDHNQKEFNDILQLEKNGNISYDEYTEKVLEKLRKLHNQANGVKHIQNNADANLPANGQQVNPPNQAHSEGEHVKTNKPVVQTSNNLSNQNNNQPGTPNIPSSGTPAQQTVPTGNSQNEPPQELNQNTSEDSNKNDSGVHPSKELQTIEENEEPETKSRKPSTKADKDDGSTDANDGTKTKNSKKWTRYILIFVLIALILLMLIVFAVMRSKPIREDHTTVLELNAQNRA